MAKRAVPNVYALIVLWCMQTGIGLLYLSEIHINVIFCHRFKTCGTICGQMMFITIIVKVRCQGCTAAFGRYFFKCQQQQFLKDGLLLKLDYDHLNRSGSNIS